MTRAVKRAVHGEDAGNMRVPSQLAIALIPQFRRGRDTFSIEEVEEPFDVFGTVDVRHALRPVFCQWFIRKLRWRCVHAVGLA